MAPAAFTDQPRSLPNAQFTARGKPFECMACNNAVSATDGGQLELECGHSMHRECIKKDMHNKLRKKMHCFYCKQSSKIGQAIYDEELRRDDKLREEVMEKEEKIQEDAMLRHMASEMHKTGELVMSNRKRQAQIDALRRFEKKAAGNDGNQNDGSQALSASQKRKIRKKKLKEMKKKYGQSKNPKKEKKEIAKKPRKGKKSKKKSKYILRNEDDLMDRLQSMGLAGLRSKDAASAPSYTDELGRSPKFAITEKGVIYNGRKIPWGNWNSHTADCSKKFHGNCEIILSDGDEEELQYEEEYEDDEEDDEELTHTGEEKEDEEDIDSEEEQKNKDKNKDKIQMIDYHAHLSRDMRRTINGENNIERYIGSDAPRHRRGSWKFIDSQRPFINPHDVPIEFDNIHYFTIAGGPTRRSGWRFKVKYRYAGKIRIPEYVLIWNMFIEPLCCGGDNDLKSWNNNYGVYHRDLNMKTVIYDVYGQRRGKENHQGIYCFEDARVMQRRSGRMVIDFMVAMFPWDWHLVNPSFDIKDFDDYGLPKKNVPPKPQLTGYGYCTQFFLKTGEYRLNTKLPDPIWSQIEQRHQDQINLNMTEAAAFERINYRRHGYQSYESRTLGKQKYRGSSSSRSPSNKYGYNSEDDYPHGSSHGDQRGPSYRRQNKRDGDTGLEAYRRRQRDRDSGLYEYKNEMTDKELENTARVNATIDGFRSKLDSVKREYEDRIKRHEEEVAKENEERMLKQEEKIKAQTEKLDKQAKDFERRERKQQEEFERRFKESQEATLRRMEEMRIQFEKMSMMKLTPPIPMGPQSQPNDDDEESLLQGMHTPSGPNPELPKSPSVSLDSMLYYYILNRSRNKMYIDKNQRNAEEEKVTPLAQIRNDENQGIEEEIQTPQTPATIEEDLDNDDDP